MVVSATGRPTLPILVLLPSVTGEAVTKQEASVSPYPSVMRAFGSTVAILFAAASVIGAAPDTATRILGSTAPVFRPCSVKARYIGGFPDTYCTPQSCT